MLFSCRMQGEASINSTTYSGLSGLDLTVRVPLAMDNNGDKLSAASLTAREQDGRIPYGEGVAIHTGLDYGVRLARDARKR